MTKQNFLTKQRICLLINVCTRQLLILPITVVFYLCLIYG